MAARASSALVLHGGLAALIPPGLRAPGRGVRGRRGQGCPGRDPPRRSHLGRKLAAVRPWRHGSRGSF